MKNMLPVTKGTFRFEGQVARMTGKYSHNQGEKNGKEFCSAKFSVKTSLTNEHFVEIFGMEQDSVYPYSAKEKKSLTIPYSKRYDKLPATYHLIAVNLGIKSDGKDGTESVNLVEFDAVKHIRENLKDGDFVHIHGDSEFYTYEDKKTNQTKAGTRWTIRAIWKIAPINFEASDFVEVASFGQQFVFTGAAKDKDTNRLLIDGYAVYKVNKSTSKFEPTNGLVVNMETHAKMTEKLQKCKFGDLFDVAGLVINQAVVDDAPEEAPDEWGSTTPAGYENRGVRHTVSELVITKVADYEAKKYKEDDFAPDEALAAFGGNGINGGEKVNPFAEEEDDTSNPFPD